MAKTPDKREQQRQFAALDFAARRAIVKSVNRGRAVEVRKHAPLAVSVARRQIRFWRWAWLVGPGIGAVQLAFAPPEVALINAMVATLILFVMAWILIRRAHRSLAANIAIIEGRVGPPSTGRRRSPARNTQDSGDTASGDSGTTGNEAALPDALPRPPAPRGKKRRR